MKHRWYTDKDYVRPLAYAIRESSFWVNFCFFFVVAFWIGQELAIRDAFPLVQHRRLHHVLDILSVIWGSFVTGYIFHWVVAHVPDKRKQYERDLDMERSVGMIMANFQGLVVQLLKGIKRDPEVKGSIYAFAYAVDPPPIVDEMVAVRENMFPDSFLHIPRDPFYAHFESTIAQIRLSLADLYDTRHTLDDRLRGVVVDMHEKLDRDFKNDLRDHKQRLEDYEVLVDSVHWLFEYVRDRAKAHKIISPFLMAEYHWSTYQQAWTEAEEEERESERERQEREKERANEPPIQISSPLKEEEDLEA